MLCCFVTLLVTKLLVSQKSYSLDQWFFMVNGETLGTSVYPKRDPVALTQKCFATLLLRNTAKESFGINPIMNYTCRLLYRPFLRSLWFVNWYGFLAKFLQSISSTMRCFCANFLASKMTRPNCKHKEHESCFKHIRLKKAASKMLVKSTLRVNCICMFL